MTRPLVLIAIAVALAWPVRRCYLRARWTARVPRASIVLWQAIGLSFVVAMVGTCIDLGTLSSPVAPRRQVNDFTAAASAPAAPHALSPDAIFGVTAALIVLALLLGIVTLRAADEMRVRSRHRMLVDLVGDPVENVPGALVLDHPAATAYSLPGLRPRIVVSSGAVAALSADELAAVVAHERAHLRARHDLVLLPLRALSVALPRSRVLASVESSVSALVEMAADDRALAQCSSTVLARALCRMASADESSPDRTSSVSSTMLRVERVLAPRKNARLLAFGSGLSSFGVVALPIVTTFMRLGVR